MTPQIEAPQLTLSEESQRRLDMFTNLSFEVRQPDGTFVQHPIASMNALSAATEWVCHSINHNDATQSGDLYMRYIIPTVLSLSRQILLLNRPQNDSRGTDGATSLG